MYNVWYIALNKPKTQEFGKRLSVNSRHPIVCYSGVVGGPQEAVSTVRCVRSQVQKTNYSFEPLLVYELTPRVCLVLVPVFSRGNRCL